MIPSKLQHYSAASSAHTHTLLTLHCSTSSEVGWKNKQSLHINRKANKVRLGKTDTGSYLYNQGYLTMPACQEPKMRNTKSEARHFLIHYGIVQKHTAGGGGGGRGGDSNIICTSIFFVFSKTEVFS